MKTNSFFSIKRWLISVFNPPYQFTLDEIIKDPVLGQSLYVFKEYGGHDFVKISYDTICKSKGIMRAINPDDLKQIHINEYQYAMESQAYKVTGYLRNNEYIIENNERTEKHSGEYISKNLDMFKSIDPIDVWKIAYAEGFTKGRKMSHDIIHKNGIKVISEMKSSIEQKSCDNVVDFSNIKQLRK